MVGKCIRKAGEVNKALFVGRAYFSLDELTTVLAEIEAVLNSLPLSYVSSEDIEDPSPLLTCLLAVRILNLPDNLDYVRPR